MKTGKFMAAVVILAALAACQKEKEGVIETEYAAGPHTVTITASLSDQTKTLISQDGSGHFNASWEAGDVIYVKEWVTGVSSDPNLGELESGSSFVATTPLEAGGETATFTATFDGYYWEDPAVCTPEELATYTFTYKYFACTFNPYYTRGDGEDMYIPLMIDPNQSVFAGGYNTSGDMLVSRMAEYVGTGRPAEIAFNFARLGTIVKMTLSGLQAGDEVKSGTWFTGDKMLAAVTLEDIVNYYPEQGKYSYGIPDYMGEDSSSLESCRQVNFSCTDDTRPIIADAEGKAELYLRVLPGVCDDWFGMVCTVDRGGEELSFSKLVDLASLGRSLQFKDGGLTKFDLALKPATVRSPEHIMYAVPKPRTGFLAAWEADPHASGYECYYQRYGDYDKIILTPEAGTGEMEGMYTVEVPGGLEPDRYFLYVRAIPESDYGLSDFHFMEKEMFVGTTAYLRWPDVDSYGSTTHLDDLGGGILKVYEDGNELTPWYFDATNLRTNWGQIFSKDDTNPWTLATRTLPSFQLDGEIQEIDIALSSSKENTLTVYGVRPDGTSVEIAMPEPSYLSERNYYHYDLSGGSYNGFRIESGSKIYVYMLQIQYYPPTGE